MPLITDLWKVALAAYNMPEAHSSNEQHILSILSKWNIIDSDKIVLKMHNKFHVIERVINKVASRPDIVKMISSISNKTNFKVTPLIMIMWILDFILVNDEIKDEHINVLKWYDHIFDTLTFNKWDDTRDFLKILIENPKYNTKDDALSTLDANLMPFIQYFRSYFPDVDNNVNSKLMYMWLSVTILLYWDDVGKQYADYIIKN